MTQLSQIYKCEVCGNVVEVLHTGEGELVCCGEPMNLLKKNTEDAAAEKHVPVIKKTDVGVKVAVGEVAHPMDDDHYIEWIEVEIHGKVCRKHLKPGDSPEVQFDDDLEIEKVRAYCNLHGLWKA